MRYRLFIILYEFCIPGEKIKAKLYESKYMVEKVNLYHKICYRVTYVRKCTSGVSKL